MRTAEREMVRHALKMEADARRAAFNKLEKDGHVTVMLDEQPDVIRVRVDEEFFLDARSTFPSTVLMAKLQLAVAAGQSDRNCPMSDKASHQVDMYRYLADGIRQHQSQQFDNVWLDEVSDFKTGGDYLYPNKPPAITATVKKFKKGLRP